MRGFIQEGIQMEFTAPSGGVTSGVPVLIGSLLVVPSITAAVGERFNAKVTGVFRYTKAASQAWTEGLKIYWDNRAVGSGGQRFTSDGTQGPLAGVAAEVVAGGADDTEGVVRLNGTASSLLEGPQAALVDLTDSTGLSGTHDDTLAATTVPAAITGGESPTEAEHNALRAVVAVMAQNQSDLAQKVIEIRAILVGAGLAT